MQAGPQHLLHLRGVVWGAPYALQAAIVACYSAAATAAETDWPRIAGLYADLAAVLPSPVVELKRAVAVGMAQGPEAGLRVLAGVAEVPATSGEPPSKGGAWRSPPAGGPTEIGVDEA